MPQSFASLFLHVVFSTKQRRPLLDDAWCDRLFGIVGGTLRADRCVLLATGGMPDHVHLLMSLARDCSVSVAVRNLKTASSRWVHETIPGGASFAWQDGYAAFSIGVAMIDDTRAYLAKQREHHARQNYQDEVRAFLRRHDIPPDEQHMWD